MQTPAQPLEKLLAYSESHRARMQWAAWMLIAVIVWADWYVGVELSPGFLYILPVLLISSQISRIQIVLLGIACSLLLEQFHPDAWQSGTIIRLPLALGGFTLAGFFVSEL